jgi:alpha-L-fucosidase 2
MDFALLKELLSNLVSVAKSRNIDTECQKTWEKMLCAIPEYEINEDGAMKEWLHSDFKDNYQHRHQSHIYPLFPGFEINEDDTPNFMRLAVSQLKKDFVSVLKRKQVGVFHIWQTFLPVLQMAKRRKSALTFLSVSAQE